MTSQYCIDTFYHRRATGPLFQAWGGWPRVAAVLRLWWHRNRQRRRLLELEDRLLEDIGISRDAARREAAKPFWRQ